MSSLASLPEQRAGPRSRTLKFCESVESFPFGLRRLFSLRVVSKRVQQFSGIFVIVEVLCRVLILSSRYRDSSHRHTPHVHLRAFASRTLCLWRHVQCRGFSCSLGRCSRPEAELSESPSAKQSVRALQELSLTSRSAVHFQNWSELELEYPRAAECHSELVLMMTTRTNCHLN